MCMRKACLQHILLPTQYKGEVWFPSGVFVFTLNSNQELIWNTPAAKKKIKKYWRDSNGKQLLLHPSPLISRASFALGGHLRITRGLLGWGSGVPMPLWLQQLFSVPIMGYSLAYWSQTPLPSSSREQCTPSLYYLCSPLRTLKPWYLVPRLHKASCKI